MWLTGGGTTKVLRLPKPFKTGISMKIPMAANNFNVRNYADSHCLWDIKNAYRLFMIASIPINKSPLKVAACLLMIEERKQ